jgi:predicted MFS family arabinose efflux permease
MQRFLPDFRRLPRPFWVLFAGTLVNRTGGFVLVFLAIYLTEVRGLGTGVAGAVISAYGLGAIAGGPLGGALSDRLGRRATLAVSLVAGGTSMLILGFVVRAAAIVVAAAGTGLLYEMYRPVVAATVADVVPSEDRSRAYGLIYWAVNLGASIAPILGGVIAARSYRLLFIADGGTTLAYGALVWAALPETRPSPDETRAGLGGVRTVLRDRLLLSLCALTFASCLVFFQSFVGLPIDMRAHGISAAGFGAAIALNGILIVLLQPVATELVQGRSRLQILAAASALIGIGFGTNVWATTTAGYAGGIAIWTCGEILFAPTSMSLVADLSPPDLRGAYQGAFALAFTAAFAAAPAIGGVTLAHAGARGLWLGCLALSGMVSAGFLLLSTRASPRFR